jgi:hypothetical protein
MIITYANLYAKPACRNVHRLSKAYLSMKDDLVNKRVEYTMSETLIVEVRGSHVSDM